MSPIGADTDTVYVTQHICKNERTTVVLSQRKVEVNEGFSIKSCGMRPNPESRGLRPSLLLGWIEMVSCFAAVVELRSNPEENESRRCRIQGR